MHEKKDLKLNNKKLYNIGIITDIHGNDKALKEVLNCLKDCDFIISLGDLIGIGPNSNEVLDIVTKLDNFYTVLGNHERYYLYGFNNPLSCLSDYHQKFTEDSINIDYDKYMESIPMEIEIEWMGKTICFLHYARRKYEGLSFKLIDHEPTYEKLVNLFEFHKQDYLFYGHEHQGSVIRKKNGRHFIDIGSTGCPCPKKGVFRYAILHLNSDESNPISYELFEKQYDPSSVIRAMIDKDMPNKELVIESFYKENLEDYQ